VDVKEYIKYLRSIEHYSFSLKEVAHHTNKKGVALKSELARLVHKKEIVNLRKGFYLIIPPRYSRQGQVPVQLYVDKLFQYLDRKYYLGLYTAAKFHGAGHQQIQREYIITEKPKLKDIKKNAIDIRFFTIAKWPDKNIVEKKSDAGIFKISDPALTAVDLIHHQNKIGGLNRMLAILEELTEEISLEGIKDLLTWYPYKSTLQRFGFLLEKTGANKELTHQIKEHLRRTKFFPVLLSHRPGQKPGAVDNFWKTHPNIKLESDL